MKVRIKFAKYGSMKYVGHLDIMRYFQKAIRRSGIPIRYSEGFNPHQIMSFAAPLGVGITSQGEYMDIELNDVLPSSQGVERLKAQMVEGMDVLQFRYLPDQAKNAMSSVTAAGYQVRCRLSSDLPYRLEDLQQEKQRFFDDATSIPVTKKTKKGERELDLRPLIYDFRIEEEADETIFFLTLSTGSVDNIKPQFVLDTFFASMEGDIEVSYHIHRIDLFTTIEEKLVSLGDIGYEQ